MPDIQFGLADHNLPVLVDLEVRFDIQLEGDSFIGFSPEQKSSKFSFINHTSMEGTPIIIFVICTHFLYRMQLGQLNYLVILSFHCHQTHSLEL